MKKKLFVLATPIGNTQDISLRGLEILKNIQTIICESRRSASTLLRRLGLAGGREYIEFNEHNDKENLRFCIEKILEKGEAVLVSDAGTPAVADPGHNLVEACEKAGIDCIPLPGANSFISALSVCGFKIHSFEYLGFPPREKSEREAYFKNLERKKNIVVLLDTAYRLSRTLSDCNLINRDFAFFLALDITKENELYIRGRKNDLVKLSEQYNKREFVLVLDLS